MPYVQDWSCIAILYSTLCLLYSLMTGELFGEHLSTVFNDFSPPQPMFYSKVFIKWFSRRKNRSHWLIQVSEVEGQMILRHVTVSWTLIIKKWLRSRKERLLRRRLCAVNMLNVAHLRHQFMLWIESNFPYVFNNALAFESSPLVLYSILLFFFAHTLYFFFFSFLLVRKLEDIIVSFFF